LSSAVPRIASSIDAAMRGRATGFEPCVPVTVGSRSFHPAEPRVPVSVTKLPVGWIPREIAAFVSPTGGGVNVGSSCPKIPRTRRLNAPNRPETLLFGSSIGTPPRAATAFRSCRFASLRARYCCNALPIPRAAVTVPGSSSAP
jgi:hypothetical protein